MGIEIKQIEGRQFGVRVSGISDDNLNDNEVRRHLRELFAEYGLIVLEDVTPSHELQIRIGEVFGAVKDYGANEAGKSADHPPGIGEMVSDPTNCTIVELNGQRLSGWMPWHFDQCYNEAPNIARVLRCGRGVSSGGMTGFLDGVELYTKFDPDLRAQIERCNVNYALDLTLDSFRYGVPADFRIIRRPASRGAEANPRVQSAAHRAVSTRQSGRKILLVSPWMATGIADLEDPTGDALLEAVAQEILALSKSLAYFHSWQLSEMVIWDNLRMLHSSTGFDPAETRIMYRTTVRAN